MNKYLIGVVTVVVVLAVYFGFRKAQPTIPTSTSGTSTTNMPSATPLPTVPTKSPTPKPSTTPKPTPKPTAKPTTTPIATPIPTATATPTLTPTPTVSTTPTPTPISTPTPTPKPEPTLTMVSPSSMLLSNGKTFFIDGTNFIIGSIIQVQSAKIVDSNNGNTYDLGLGSADIQNDHEIKTQMPVTAYGTFDVSITSIDGTVVTLPRALTVSP